MSSQLLEVKGLHASYGPSAVLHGIDLSLKQGSITTLLGANGAGKTTTLRALCQMMVTTRGEITFSGQRLDGRATERIVGMGIGHVPDGRGTFLALSTEENLRLGAYTRKDRGAVAEDMERVYSYFPRLKERSGQQAGTLSGGEQQMLAIGRALMSKPKLLLLDEPSLGLAPIIIQQIFDIIEQLRKDGVTVFLVEQNANQALKIADRAYVLENGRVVMQGTGEALLTDPKVREAYLGG